jgi:hypothetical protein
MEGRTLPLLFILMLTGCTTIPTSATVSNKIPFADRDKKISKPIGLYISQKSRTYVARQFVRKDAGMSKDGLVFTLDFGQNFEANARRSLEKMFPVVVPLQTMRFASREYSHIIQIEIDDRTTFDIGTFAFSQKKVNLYMQCKLYNRSGKVLWQEVFNSETSRSNIKGWLAGGGVLIGGIWGTYARQAGLDKLQEAAEESLWANLEMLNTRMLENQVLFK